MGERNDAACAYLGQKEHLADFLNVVYYKGDQEVAVFELEICKEVFLPFMWQLGSGEVSAKEMSANEMPVKLMMKDGKGRYYAILGVSEEVKYRFVVTVGRMGYGVTQSLKQLGQEKWQVDQIRLDDLKEEYFRTGLGVLVGILKRRDNKRTMKVFWREEKGKLEQLDEGTYNVICILSGNKRLLRKREKYYRDGGYDMYKAMEEMMQEREHRGEQRGQKRGERRGEALGEKRGEQKGIARVNELNKRLITECRLEDLKKASSNQRYQKMLLKKFKL